jgi:hypothetical protein
MLHILDYVYILAILLLSPLALAKAEQVATRVQKLLLAKTHEVHHFGVEQWHWESGARQRLRGAGENAPSDYLLVCHCQRVRLMYVLQTPEAQQRNMTH